jgi:2-polyprenyl-3-methyl-5-hydroxy-6-metoxy-1,4-benzoquinol methylase
LDLGAAQGYFSVRSAVELGCSVVAVDPDLADMSDVQNVHCVRQIVTPDYVAKFGKFDVALALSILHHIGEWRKMLDVLIANATIVIVETPHPQEILKDPRKNARLQEIYDRTRGTVLCETLSIYGTHMRETVLL